MPLIGLEEHQIQIHTYNMDRSNHITKKGLNQNELPKTGRQTTQNTRVKYHHTPSLHVITILDSTLQSRYTNKVQQVNNQQ